MSQELDALMRLGEADKKLHGARRRRSQASSLSAAQEARANDARRALDKVKDLLKQGARDLQRQEGEAKAKQGEIDKHQVSLNHAKNNDEYQALLRAIEKAKAELSATETLILEAYEGIEAKKAEQKELEARVKKAEADLADQKKVVTSEVARVDLEIAGLEKERAAAIAQADPQHVVMYEKLAQKLGDAATARVQDGDICQGCGMKVRPEQMSNIRGGQLVTCYTCGRILHKAL